MLTDENYKELEVKGYTVVSDVLTSEECDTAIGQYKEWLSQFKEGDWPLASYSLIQSYSVGHLHPTWYIRMKSKGVFAQLWKTEKLLSSIDAIAIGRPPEDGKERFHKEEQHWLHIDQSPLRVGLHAYQGAVYLEEAEEQDWTFQVMEKSHLFHQEVYELDTMTKFSFPTDEFYSIDNSQVELLKSKGCEIKRVAVPKGGMVIWDSRLVHANAYPIEGRKHADRWRYCVFVSMTPAIWASEKDLKLKKYAYDALKLTAHWSSQGVRLFSQRYHKSGPPPLPDIAKCKEAKLLSGIEMYDFEDGKPDGKEFLPKWKDVNYLAKFQQAAPEKSQNEDLD